MRQLFPQRWIRSKTSVIGGIGASFDTPDYDVQIAQAGLAAPNG
jgi:hypothetical protein